MAIERQREFLVGGLIVLLAGGVFVYRWWQRPPVVQFENLKYIQLLSTAVSSRNEEWLAKVAQAVGERHAAGEMSSSEMASFQRIMDTAAAGEWERADRECFALAEGQLNRRRAKPPAEGHGREH